MKKAVFTLLMFVLLSACAACFVSAENETSGTWKNNTTWSYDKNTKTLTLSGEGKIAKENEYPWEVFEKDIETIVVSEGITSIPERAFSFMYSVNSVVLPDSLVEIGFLAFHRCTSLKNVVIPESVNAIDYMAFEGCESLEEFSVSNTNGSFCAIEGCLYSFDRSELIKYPPNKQGEYFSVPASVKTIGRRAFSESKNLKTVVLSKVDLIAAYAFYGCSNLTVCSLCESLNTIDIYAFEYCGLLKEITVYENINEIWFGAFDHCSSLEKINLLSAERLKAEYDNEELEIDLSDPYAVAEFFREDSDYRICVKKYVIGFYADDKLIKRIEYEKGDTVIVPAIPVKEGYTGEWENFKDRLYKDSIIKVNVVYNCDHPAAFVADIQLVDPTYDKEGSTAGRYCTRCGEYIEGHEVIPKLEKTKYHIDFYNGDTLVKSIDYYTGDRIDEPAVPEREGYGGKWEKYELHKDESVTVHAVYECLHYEKYVETVSEVTPTESRIGYTAGTYCTVCGKYLTGHTEIPALGNTSAYVQSFINRYPILCGFAALVLAVTIIIVIIKLNERANFGRTIEKRTVRLCDKNGTSFATGLIYRSDGKRMYIMTCKHVFTAIGNSEISVRLISGKSYLVNEVINSNNDVCLAVAIELDKGRMPKMKRLSFADVKTIEKIKNRRTTVFVRQPDSKINSEGLSCTIRKFEITSHDTDNIFFKSKCEDLKQGDSGTVAYCGGRIIGIFADTEGPKDDPSDWLFIRSDIIKQVLPKAQVKSEKQAKPDNNVEQSR